MNVRLKLNVNVDKKFDFFHEQHQTPFKEKLMREFYNVPVWMILIGSFMSGCLAKANMHVLALIIFIIFLVVYYQINKSKQDENIEYFVKKISQDEEMLRRFLGLIGAINQNLINSSNSYEPCEWINEILLKFWPIINRVIQRKIDERKLDKRGINIGHGHLIYLEQFTLGDSSPKIAQIEYKKTPSVEQQEQQHDEIKMVLKVRYLGNCKVSFYYKTLCFMKARAGVKDVNFAGDAVLVMHPLLTSPPFIGGIWIYLVDAPEINYDGTDFANLADNRLFKNFLVEVISSIIVMPNKIHISFMDQLSDNDVDKIKTKDASNE